jgi:hypothetical protein
VNWDETFWTIVMSVLLTSSTVGEEKIRLYIDGKKKDSVTVLASVTTARLRDWQRQAHRDRLWSKRSNTTSSGWTFIMPVKSGKIVWRIWF